MTQIFEQMKGEEAFLEKAAAAVEQRVKNTNIKPEYEDADPSFSQVTLVEFSDEFSFGNAEEAGEYELVVPFSTSIDIRVDFRTSDQVELDETQSLDVSGQLRVTLPSGELNRAAAAQGCSVQVEDIDFN